MEVRCEVCDAAMFVDGARDAQDSVIVSFQMQHECVLCLVCEEPIEPVEGYIHALCYEGDPSAARKVLLAFLERKTVVPL